MKHEIFTIEKGKLLCWRLGNINSVKQVHYSRDIETDAGMGTHKPPVSRGVWAFPYPHYDYFFCFHQWKKHLPKDITESSENYEEKLKEIQNRFKPKKFWTNSLWSHIFPNNKTYYNDWYYWDSVNDWEKIAKKHLVMRENFNGKLMTFDYSKDHLEIFVVI